jgi:TP901 family phage tail tape measure protein
MAVEVTTLVLETKSTGIKQAATDLNALANAATNAQTKAGDAKTGVSGLNAETRNTASALEKALAQMEKQNKLLGANTSQINSYKISTLEATTAQKTLAQTLGAEVDAFNRLKAAQAAANIENRKIDRQKELAETREVKKATDALADAKRKATAEEKRTQTQQQAVIAGLARQFALLGANTSEINSYKLSLLGASKAQKAAVQELGAQVDAYKRLAAAQEKAIKENARLDAQKGNDTRRIKLTEETRQTYLYREAIRQATEATRLQEVADRKADVTAKKLAAERARNANELRRNTLAHIEALAINERLDAERRRSTQSIHSNTNALRVNNAALLEAHALARGLSGAFGSLWVTYGNPAGIAAGLAIGTSLLQVLKVGQEVERQLNFVYALSESGRAVNLDDFLKITDTSVQPVTEAANALRLLAQNGLEVGQSLSVLPSILNLATVGEISVGQAAIATTGAISAFGLSISDAELVTDIFAKTAASSNTSVEALTESMKQASTVSTIFGVDIQTTSALLGSLAKINITGGAAGTALTNALTGIFTPTKEGAKALQALGVSATDTTGKFKNIIVVLEELKQKTSDLSDEDRNAKFSDFTTARGLKQLTNAIDNLDAIKKNIKGFDEVLGFSKGVVEKLEDSSVKAFDRVAATLKGEFTRAFFNAEAEVQNLGNSLTTLFKGDETNTKINEITGAVERVPSALGNLTQNLAILANALVTNLGTVSLLVGGYALWRAAIGYTIVQQTAAGVSTITLGGLYTAYTAAVAASTAATLAATVAQDAQIAAQAGGASTTALETTAINTRTAATVAGTVATRAFYAVLFPALGIATVAIAAASAAWLLLRDNTSDSGDANLKVANTIKVVGDQLAREIEQLERSIDLWDAREGRFRDSTAVTPATRELAEKNLAFAEETLAKNLGITREELSKNSSQLELYAKATKGAANIAPIKGLIDVGNSILDIRRYNEAKEAIKGLDKQVVLSTRKVFDESVKNSLDGVEKLRNEVTKFIDEAGRVGSKGPADFLEADVNRRDIRQSKEVFDVLRELNKLKDVKVKALNPNEVEAYRKELDKLSIDFDRVQKKLDKTVRVLPKEVDKSAVNDTYSAAILQQTKAIKVAKKELETFQQQQNDKFNEGEIGKLGVIQAVADKEIEIGKKVLAALKAQRNIAGTKANGATEVARYNAEIEAVEEKTANDRRRVASALELAVAGIERETTNFQIKEYEIRGQYAEAAALRFGAGWKLATAQATKDVEQFGDAYATLGKNTAQQKAFANAEIATAKNKEAVASFNVLAESTINAFKAVNTASEGLGINEVLTQATAASNAFLASANELERRKGTITGTKEIIEADATLTRIAEAQRKLWAGVGESISRSLGEAFGLAGASLGDLIVGTIKYDQLQARIEGDRIAAIKDISKNQFVLADSAGDIAKVNVAAAEKERAARIRSYGDAAGAAKKFFKEGSTGYKVLEAAEKTFRAIELAEALRSFIVKSSFLTGLLGIKLATDATAIASDTQYTFVSLAKSALRAAASGVEAIAKALSSLPYPYNIAAAAATAAALVGLGVKVFGGGGGGGGGPSPEERQKSAGTGSVLGDDKAKSDSIARSLTILEKNSGLGLVHTSSMVNSLTALVDSFAGLTSIILNTTGLGGNTVPGVTEGTTPKSSGLLSPLSNVINTLSQHIPIIGGLLTKLFGTTTSVIDQGITATVRTLDQIKTIGFNSQTYADVASTTKFFGLTVGKSFNTTLLATSSEIDLQFGSIINSLSENIISSAGVLGYNTGELTERLKTFVVDIGKISTKGLTGEEIQKQFQAVFSKVGDDIAKFGVVGLKSFQKAGEGYFETVNRLANDFIQTSDVIDVLGKTSQEAFGAVGFASIAMRESLITAAGGLEKLTGGTKFFIDNFLSEADRIAPVAASVKTELARLNLANVSTVEQYKEQTLAALNGTVAGQELYAALLNLAPAFLEVVKYTDDLANGTVALTAAQQNALDIVTKQRELDITLLEAQGRSIEATAARRADELVALAKLSPTLIATQQAIYATVDASDLAARTRKYEIELLNIQGRSVEALALTRMDELAAVAQINPALVAMQQAIYDATDAASGLARQRSLDILLLEAQGKAAEALTARREDELRVLTDSQKITQLAIYAAQAANDANKALEAERAKSRSQELEYLSLIGVANVVLNAQRAEELKTLTASQQVLQLAIFATQDYNKQREIELSLLETQGFAYEALTIRRRIEILSLNETQASIQRMVFATQDANKERELELTLYDALAASSKSLVITREQELKALSASQRVIQNAVYAAQDRAKLAADDFSVLGKAVNAAKATSQAAYEAQAAILDAQKSAATTAYESTKTAIEATLESANKANTAISDLVSSLSSTLSTLLGNFDAGKQRAEGQKQLDTALAVFSTSGVFPTAKSLEDALKFIAQPSEGLFKTFQEYAIDQGVTAGKIADLNNAAIGQKSVGELQVEALQSSLELLKQTYDAQIAGYDSQLVAAKEKLDRDIAQFESTLDLAQKQLDVSLGTNIAIKSVEDAIRAFNISVGAVIAGQQAAGAVPTGVGFTPSPTAVGRANAGGGASRDTGLATTPDITSAYKTAFGLPPNEMALSYWQGVVTRSGFSANSLEEYLTKVRSNLPANFVRLDGSHEDGLDSVPFDGYVAQLHKGETVLNAASAKNYRDDATMKDLIEVITQMKDDNSTENRAIIEWVKKQFKLLERVTPDGDSIKTS